MTANRSRPEESHFRCLDGLRGVAILLVVIKHTTTLPVPKGTASQMVSNFVDYCGENGVMLFFALSGFLVSLPFWRLRVRRASEIVPRQYVWRRFIKIYPPLALTVVAFFPIYVFLKPQAYYLWTEIAWLTGAALFLPVNGDINSVMWTLVAEVQYYMVLPAVMALFVGLSLRWSLWIIPAALLLTGAAARWCCFALGLTDSLYPTVYVPPLVHLDAFSMGVLVAGLHAAGRLGRRSTVLGQVACLGTIGLMLILSYPALNAAYADPYSLGHEVGTYLKIFLFGSILFILADPGCVCARILSHPLLCWFGLISYEWYLIHVPIYIWIRDAVGATHGHALVHIAMQVAAIVLGLALAAITYYKFSAPLLRWGKTSAQSVRQSSELVAEPGATLAEP